MSHEVHLISCALRFSSKVQEVQSLENFVSISIQGTQVPIYTNIHCFCIFPIFQIFIFIFMKKKKTEKQPNKNIKKHTKHKTRLTQKLERKQTSNAKHKRRERKSD